MSRKVKCYGPYCEPYGIKHEKENMKKISGKNYCPECYEIVIKEKEEQESLYKYLTNEYGFVTPLMKKHAKEMHNSNGWSYKRIEALIKFTINIEKRKYDMKYGLTLYQNSYKEFIDYIKQRKENKNNNKGKENKKETITVNSELFNKNKYKNNMLYDMEE
ncbi:hypothetical protein CoNPh11_CDS0188 [Staphylococcus phage S-CoN_Ph11]|nr:hypothetical protein CoNPh1_CDS0031 [Staphylococcus phage S-CoN_Ph1]WNM51681.1 hypothetical protein CoNPh2_CDS0127 [Staphylococcus phage S-CoN_Ph2]WNM51843.1 hypothetical protein CoNPh3_CDS0129 [Staphylococcus phage S-CoN_Ph3]WNM51910.1 hypothetical protein CoNPh4_CDS0034 [Staphylococcus phage S-CoN_Ph4]WNM52093.1 hypothetical protein CoNPh5_CDS0047 [Staphylococcus phage S-CoN_Ph5]WNM52342.1 hypothetical protein CoNPh6_CDS0132 [Staphylococcus phage S-CoN_Ph6]WNM52518.1 hypothetical protein